MRLRLQLRLRLRWCHHQGQLRFSLQLVCWRQVSRETFRRRRVSLMAHAAPGPPLEAPLPPPPPPLARPEPTLYPPSARSADIGALPGATEHPLACPPQAPQRCATKMDTQTKILSLFLDTRPVFTLGAASWFAPTAGLSPSRPSCDTPSVPERSSTRKLTYA